MLSRALWFSALLALAGSACRSDESAGAPAPDLEPDVVSDLGDPDAVEGDVSDDIGEGDVVADVPQVGCQSYRDCEAPLVCRAGDCVTAVMPVLAEEAARVVTADDPEQNVLINGRLIRPASETVLLGTFPSNIALAPDGSTLVVNETGFGTRGEAPEDRVRAHRLRVLDPETLAIRQVLRMPNGSMHIGLAFSPDGSRLYVAGGNDDSVHVYAVGDDGLTLERSIVVGSCYTTHLAIAADESRLYTSCYLQARAVEIDLASGAVLRTFNAGPDAFSIALSPDGSRLWVVNAAGRTARPAIGDTVSVLDLTVEAPERERIPVGLGPVGLLLGPDGDAWVACNKTDDLWRIDAEALVAERWMGMHDDTVYGSGPTALAVDADWERMYVANALENYVAVVDIDERELLGRIPTEWYPNALALDEERGALIVSNGKGRGDGPNVLDVDGDEEDEPEDRASSGRALRGSVLRVALPDAEGLAAYSTTVESNNTRQFDYFEFPDDINDTPLPRPGRDETSPIRYLFLILKENFSFDAAYGGFPGANGDAAYATWSEDLLPNQWALASEFALLDNFYCDSEGSIDGHQWAVSATEPDYVERGWVLDYAGFGFPTIAVSLTPGSVPASAFFMPHLLAQGIEVLGFGGAENFGVELISTYRDYYLTGYPVALADTFRDVERAELFEEELAARIEADTVPSFSWVFLPNNHGFGVGVGRPTPESWVADNDEGVGRVVAAIAASPIWEESLILMFEDDAQSGYDSVEKHRCPALAIGPWVRRGYISHAAYSMPNIHRTIELILGSEPMTRFDAQSTGMYDLFGSRPDTTPFVARPNEYGWQIYEGVAGDQKILDLSRRLDWDDIDRNPEANQLYWMYRHPGRNLPVR